MFFHRDSSDPRLHSNAAFIDLIEVELIYNTVLVSGVQHSDSVIHIHVSILFQILSPFRLLKNIGASLVAQWLRVCLLMQGTRVRALAWEDPTCREAAGPVSHNC